jgi:hypothetical protein
MHPKIRRDLALHRQLDHVNRRRMSKRTARPAFQRRLKFPDRRIARTADMFKRNAGACFAAVAFHLQPAVCVLEAYCEEVPGLSLYYPSRSKSLPNLRAFVDFATKRMRRSFRAGDYLPALAS